MNPPEHPPDDRHTGGQAPLRRFHGWHGFLVASLALNALFVHAMLGASPEPAVRAWYKVLIWFPFNAIATAVYLALMARLARGAGSAAAAGLYIVLCGALIAVNWVLLLSA